MQTKEEVLIVVAKTLFPTSEAAKAEAVRYCLAGVKNIVRAIPLGIRETRWPDTTGRWYVTINIYWKTT